MKRINENSETNPDSLHGLMHITREKFLILIFLIKRIYFIRPTLVYGKNILTMDMALISFMREDKKNKKIQLFGNGEEV